MDKWIQGNEYKGIIGIATILIAILVSAYFIINGSPGDFFRNSIINLVVEIVSILTTVFLLTQLLNMRQKRISKEKAREITKHSYPILVASFFKEFHLFLTKKQLSEKDPLNNDLNLLAEKTIAIRDDIENIITKDFFLENPRGVVFTNRSTDIFENFKEQEIDLFEMSIAMKEANRKRIDDYLSKYSVIIPDDLRSNLYKLDNLLMTSAMLLSPYELGMTPHREDIKFNPEDFQEQSVEILNTLYELLVYFEEMEPKK